MVTKILNVWLDISDNSNFMRRITFTFILNPYIIGASIRDKPDIFGVPCKEVNNNSGSGCTDT